MKASNAAYCAMLSAPWANLLDAALSLNTKGSLALCKFHNYILCWLNNGKDDVKQLIVGTTWCGRAKPLRYTLFV